MLVLANVKASTFCMLLRSANFWYSMNLHNGFKIQALPAMLWLTSVATRLVAGSAVAALLVLGKGKPKQCATFCLVAKAFGIACV